MVFVILGVLIGIKKSVHDCYKDGNRISTDLVMFFCYSILGIIIGGLIGFFVAWLMPMELSTKKETVEIVALQDNNSVNGSFFLGSGYVDGNMEFILYYECENGFKMMQLSPKHTLIRYSKDKPTLTVNRLRPTDNWINYFGFDRDVLRETYTINVPEGTILNHYSLDAK